jgi:hypothetical protein
MHLVMAPGQRKKTTTTFAAKPAGSAPAAAAPAAPAPTKAPEVTEAPADQPARG